MVQDSQTFIRRAKKYGNSIVVAIPPDVCDIISLRKNQYIEVTIKKYLRGDSVDKLSSGIPIA